MSFNNPELSREEMEDQCQNILDGISLTLNEFGEDLKDNQLMRILHLLGNIERIVEEK